MFSRHHGNETVPAGTYLCLTTGEFVNVADSGGRLPGVEDARYLEVNPLVALLVGPIAGLLFVIFLPLAVPLFILWLLARRLGLSAPAAVSQIARALNHQPVRAAYAGEAALGRHAARPTAAHGQQPPKDRQSVDELLAELERRSDDKA